MAGFQYFVENRHHVTLADARGLGLGYAFPNGCVCSRFDGPGPGNAHGCVIAPTADRIGFYGERQTWRPLVRPGAPADSPRLFVGYWNDAKPGPADLAMAEQLRGRPLKLKDGNQWLVPIAKEHRGGLSFGRVLPGLLTRDDAGNWQPGEIEPRYARLWEIANEFWGYLFGAPAGPDNAVRFDFAGANDAAVEVLAYNYRLGPDEVVALGLLDDQLELAGAILKATIDFETFWEWQKKNQAQATPVGSPMSDGGADSPPTTPPPAPTCGPSRRSRKAGPRPSKPRRTATGE